MKISWMIPSAFLMPSIFGALQGCKDKGRDMESLQVFNGEQCELIKAISDTMIPKTSTPSASEVNVHGYLDLLLKDVFGKRLREAFLKGLNEFEKNCQSCSGKGFVSLDESEKCTYLEEIERECLKRAHEQNEMTPFYLTIKKLVVSIYFSTEQGVKQNLNYVPIPGPYKGEIEYIEGERIMIGNRM